MNTAIKSFSLRILAMSILIASVAPLAQAKRIGLQLYSVMDAMNKNPETTLTELGKIGYNTFELVQWGGSEKVFGMEPLEFKKMCNRVAGKIVSTHSSLQEDPANEKANLDQWRKLFAIQKACGGKYFVIPSYSVEYNKADVKRMADYFNRVGKIAREEFGLQLGYHNHHKEFNKLADSDQTMWEYLVENTDPENVFYELDVYWCSKGGQDPVELLAKYPKRIKMLHVKDEFVIGESGDLDFEGIFKQFYKNGMKDYVVEIETPGWLRDKTNADGSKYTRDQINAEIMEAAQKSYDYLNKAKFVK